jgi:curved DNA-binding protein
VNYYEILGVESTATEEDIKKAYRKMAMKHHPDRGGDQTEFQKIQEAYAILSDAQKRQQYDNPQQQNFNQFNGMPPNFEEILRSFGMGGFRNVDDIFARQHRPHNRTLNLQTTITLEDAFSGKEIIANIQLPSGREQIINVKIPAGVQDGTVLRLREIGDDSVPNIPRGDVHLTVGVLQHGKFHRQGDDLILEVDLNAFEAMLGCVLPVRTLDDKLLDVNIAAQTQTVIILGVKVFGLHNLHDPRFKGRLLLKLKVVIPVLNEEQKTLVQQAMLLGRI